MGGRMSRKLERVPNEGWEVVDCDFWGESAPDAIEAAKLLITRLMDAAHAGDHVFVVSVATGDVPDSVTWEEATERVKAALRPVLEGGRQG